VYIVPQALVCDCV